MKESEEIKANTRRQRWRLASIFSKNFFIYFVISFILLFSFFIFFYRFINPPTMQIENSNFTPLSTLASTPTPTPQSISPEELSVLQNNEVNNLNQNHKTLDTSHHQLVALELLRETLEGRSSLRYFVLYLLRHPDPWTIKIVDTLPPIVEIKTHAELQKLLVPPPSSQPSSKWKHITNILSFFVKIKKLDTEDQQMVGNLDDIQKALRKNNIQQALDAFDKLPIQEQARLNSWKQEALNRLILEKIKQQLLIELAEG